MSNSIHFEIERAQLSSSRVVQETLPANLATGDVLLKIERFGLTANNITYAVSGESLNYWGFFPAADTAWGRVPCWGFAQVVASACQQVSVGERVFGYLPMSSHLVVTPGKFNAMGWSDVAAHRPTHAPLYNQYQKTSGVKIFTPEFEALHMILWPLFATSFLLQDFLAETGAFENVVLVSASSKTAIGLAWLLKQAGQRVTALTSDSNRSFVSELGYYDQVLSYEELDQLPAAPSAVVDMSGNAATIRKIHQQLGEQVLLSSSVGATHWQSMNPAANKQGLPGATPQFFFAPTQVKKFIDRAGLDGFQSALMGRWLAFSQQAADWMEFVQASGVANLERGYLSLLNGAATPTQALSVSLSNS